MIVIGFTGTRKGMSDHQKKMVRELMKDLPEKGEIHHVVHGGCVGADMEFHEIFLGFERHVRPGFSVHNPADLIFRGDFTTDASYVHPPKPYLERNKDIVDECSILIACPYDRSGKGGTWSTINYANKRGKSHIIIHRDGES